MAPRKGKTYRTSSGQQVDFGALLLNNETVPALGNMNVNARGDEIDPAGNITKSREDIMREYNELNTMVPQDGDIPQGTGIEADDDWQDWEPPVKKPEFSPVENMSVPTTEVASQDQENTEAEVAPVGTNIGKQISEQAEAEESKTPTGGLAAAVAAAKKPESNVQQSAQEQVKQNPGVRRI